MSNKDQPKDTSKATKSIPSTAGDVTASLADKLGGIDLKEASASASTSTKGASTGAVSLDDFDINDIDDPLAGFEAQQSGINDLSLKV
jgi:hypothetical protein